MDTRLSLSQPISAARPSIKWVCRCRKRHLALAKQSDAVLLGAVGGPRWEEFGVQPAAGARVARHPRGLGLYANLRPAKLYSNLVDASTLKREVVEGIDILVIRELDRRDLFRQTEGDRKVAER